MAGKKYNRAIIFANGDIPDTALLQKRLADGRGPDKDDIIICADGGASNALMMGLVPDIVIGDMDSLGQSVKDRLGGKSGGTSFIGASKEKDESYTRLAVEYALGLGQKKIIIAGALGGRIDHSLANIFLLNSPSLKDIDIRIITGESEIFLQTKPCTVRGASGDLITLMSLSPYTYFTKTRGLKYRLENEKLYFSPIRGLSNVFMEDSIYLGIKKGDLLIIKHFS